MPEFFLQAAVQLLPQMANPARLSFRPGALTIMIVPEDRFASDHE